ncbi:putative metal-dependent phosphoesterase TrpH [Motilibacter rhizosphaerae]|uniref:Putative metal-dependent phosphoesterase TrpH n=1 Tax=Motilibacter rhizosphaerae TaxID=598652 RepID=A0A4Q7NGF7_9ACTN|nr:hypothetical protein [Motilibacter rhizosphaerae]RZS83001.1 putative metal-dependent phosphoesterase TrpH [Motilibacter rhizosphaerae]
MSVLPPPAALVVASGRPTLAVAQGQGSDLPGATGAARRSQLPGREGLAVVHADLHNHTLLSDGAGRPEDAYASMQRAGLDVAALTDHVSLPRTSPLPAGLPPDAVSRYRTAPPSMDAAGWSRTAALADAADEPGSFTAVRGFEWTEPWLGHVNVWFSEQMTGVALPGGTRVLHDWLHAQVEATARRAAPSGGPGPLFGFNHPGREPGRLDGFALDPRLVPRMVTLELFNRGEDYLFEGVADGLPSPLLAVHDAGWQPGLVGVTDEHGTGWGTVEGRGRAGLWVREHSRSGVAEALLARRTYATRLSGLRLDATLDGVGMGGTLPPDGTGGRLRLDVDRGPAWHGRPLEVQVLVPGAGELLPEVRAVLPLTCGTPLDAELDLRAPAAPGRPGWVVVRVVDPAQDDDREARAHAAGWTPRGRAVAYASPWRTAPA